jgi:hypothetical protein
MSLRDALNAQLEKLTAALDILKALESETRVLLGGTEPVIPVAGLDSGPEELMGELARMIDDEDLWDRRREEHIRYTEQSAAAEPVANLPAAEVPRIEPVIPTINALTKLTPEDQNRVLYSIYKDAAHAVRTTLGGAIDPNNPEHDKLIADTSDKFLKLWIEANTP